ncbi:nitrous oxide reductase accessory protein NosL [Neorhizobium sp. BT27B]|uniref:nitrous oxide reductase accessory protein NosL n=1 Tax=Neorhizobium sp. BT27B TaxID=3142625 RepID=UPI003D2D81F7
MKLTFATVALAAIFLAGCSPKENAIMPAPTAMTAEAMGRYCGMNVMEHDGPKGQVIMQQTEEVIWFSSARDTVAFTMLPEEPRDIAAIYVSDMSKAPSWEKPGAENWVDARKAHYVIESSRVGGMGTAEAVPFSVEQDAIAFAAKNGGRVVGFKDIPENYILGSQVPPSDAQAPEAHGAGGHHHG